MTRNEFLFLRRAETAKTLRLLELYPEEKRDLRPSEKSRSALELILTFIGEERVNRKLLEGKAVTPEAHRNPPASIADAIGELRKAFEEFDRAVEKLNEADLQREVSFYTFKLPLHAALTIERWTTFTIALSSRSIRGSPAREYRKSTDLRETNHDPSSAGHAARTEQSGFESRLRRSVDASSDGESADRQRAA